MKEKVLVDNKKANNLKTSILEFFEVGKGKNPVETRKRNIAAKEAYDSVLKIYSEM